MCVCVCACVRVCVEIGIDSMLCFICARVQTVVPMPPTDPTSTNNSPASVRLSWKKPVSVFNYTTPLTYNITYRSQWDKEVNKAVYQYIIGFSS